MKKAVDTTTVQQIRRARENGSTLGQLVREFRLSKSTIHKYIQGCDHSKVKIASPTRRVVQQTQPLARPELSKGDLGEAARQMICACLMLAGVQVFRPMGEDTPIDLLVLKETGEVLRCQCKYLYPTPQGSHCLHCFATRNDETGRKRRQHRYTNEEVDFFLGYCLDDNAVYVIPWAVAKARLRVFLWILRDPTSANRNGVFDHRPWRNAFQLLR